jgi:hypothetical protein
LPFVTAAGMRLAQAHDVAQMNFYIHGERL